MPPQGEKIVRERWKWEKPGTPKRQGYNNEIKNWDEKVPWGAPNVANSRRPEPHRVDAFADPVEQADAIIKILHKILQDKVKEVTANLEADGDKTEYGSLLEQVKRIQQRIVEESETQVNSVESEITDIINKIFPGYEVNFDARHEDELDKAISFFKSSPQLLMGPENGFKSDIERQGSGARRTLLWAALKYITENGHHKNKKSDRQSSLERSNILLIDEPELCLHPSAIREACKVLYDLPKTNNWQVMVTTHSPIFVDLSRDNTTIIRVERVKGKVEGTTLFRPEKVKLDDNDRRNLKLLNQFDPYVAEFFFGGKPIIVEGDTEYTAFKYMMVNEPGLFKGTHIIKARGKATIASLVKILNHFNMRYSILHDSDTPYIKNGNKNPAWGTNSKILQSVNQHPTPEKVRLVSTTKNFEYAFLDEEVNQEKPYHALMELTKIDNVYKSIKKLLYALYDHKKELPTGVIEWSQISDLEEMITQQSY